MLEAAAEEEEEWIEERRIRAKSWRVCGGGGEEGQRFAVWELEASPARDWAG
jgi:hypothetical protein